MNTNFALIGDLRMAAHYSETDAARVLNGAADFLGGDSFRPEKAALLTALSGLLATNPDERLIHDAIRAVEACS